MRYLFITALLLYIMSSNTRTGGRSKVGGKISKSLPLTINWETPERGKPYEHLFVSAGQRYNVPKSLLSKMAQAESNYNPNAVSPVGAEGLMQIMPLHGVDGFNPNIAVDYAAKYVSGLYKQFGRWNLALAAYNFGPGNLKKYLRGEKSLPAETKNYVAKILTDVPLDETVI